jgi:indolepyruvate ferredoxin oxidoreductase, alpha subunit
LVEKEKITIASDAPGESMFMLGNQAIARGAIEAGVQVFAAYPGTPSSEASETIIDLSKELGYYAEWSVNEKVAFEVAFGASTSGVRAMTAMKHVGLNVALDALNSANYMGAVGGLVVLVADDPGQWSSQNEQDSRFIAEQAYLPVLEPSSAQEAKDMTEHAFRLSEEFGQIFMLRSVTRISHARGNVKLGPINKDKPEGEFKTENRARFICMPAYSKKNRFIMIERLNRIKEAADELPYNSAKKVGGAKYGIIACGISYSYALEALRWLGLEDQVSVLKIGTPHPLPEKMVKDFLSSVPEVLVIEELEPFVENHIAVIAQKAGIDVKIHGKDMVPVVSELSTRLAVEAVAKLTGSKLPVDFDAIDKLSRESAAVLPLRPPTLCAGCPHRSTLYCTNVVARKVKKDKGQRVFVSDIGCYSLAANPPLNADDIQLCMGAGFGVANGLSHTHPGPVIAHMGDSTFFHSGITPMINAVFNNANITMIVLDNSATSMTGFQPNPGSPGGGKTGIKPEDVARACGVKFVEVVNCYNVKDTTDAIERAVRFEGPALVVARGICRILLQKEMKKTGEKAVPYWIDRETCTNCKYCINSLGCPALMIVDGDVTIDPAQCDGCGVCAQICPTNSIKPGGNK